MGNIKLIAAGLVTIAAMLGTSYVTAPEPVKPQQEACTEADGACIGWSELHYPGSTWKTGPGN